MSREALSGQSDQSWDPGLYDGRHAFVWQHGESLLALLAPQPGERILDLGCGTGHLTEQIAGAGASVVGLDHSASMLQQARATYPHVEFIEGDARDFSFAAPFDAVFSNAVLHWVRPPEHVVRCVRRALRPGGRFVAEFGGKGNVKAIVAALRTAAERIGVQLRSMPWYFPSISDYAALLEATGFEVRFASLFDRPTPLQGESGLRDWLKMFAEPMLKAVPPEHQEQFMAATEEGARAELWSDGGWIADYRRLRVVAVKDKEGGIA